MKKNLTLKSLLDNIILFSFIILAFVTLGMFNLYYVFVENKYIIFIFSTIGFCVFCLPHIIRYNYVKRVCNSSELLKAIIMEKNSSSFVRTGTYYKIKVKGSNTIFETSTMFGITSSLNINDEVNVCIDSKNKEAIIINKIY